ncbi:ubiquinone/menaquinone biosynthesis methyltransferase [Amycolatopsis mediterranei S699]|uniref:Ubiquinone/menaquinone biosynthesis methyltransferase n=2 Tax=Amycolatopsis mediterranei TaxID=33910 RepID=A0A0H3D6B9_AMYMU|nr:class I SAM-dependent methyltransferase [Amycolatopsis mediterranei]ADJ45048.1 ubiquinone/menaquinone biosynthesis methyltransferase [Amycolatopsis mediterranei U32]AEK41803.1 ubiquinone/menaquinone biosynthesis methyltransferase [Amycolatopsis mediterranei S699]AFO76760.1 ubiquinone/menaquinone biosynthesis methyltransferase [Amycolatopsis mediterranei S699]AGT83888.1 ubiquinone/menaquinone biosynthesis methyltransferase [Amycolatopsis mediterranei RB]KDO08688.1 ubiquinone biosynthesis met
MTKPERWRRYWDRKSTTYDAEMDYWDRRLFGDSRAWACGQATGEVLEVAVGTGLNLPSYPAGVTLTGVDLSEGMLAIARDRARRLGHPVTLREADAEALPFAEASFDTVVCTFGLCAIPDPAAAVGEMVRVLRPGGRLILVDHVASSSRFVRGLQWLLELASVPLAGEHFRRRPLRLVEALGLPVRRRERFKLGLVERLVAAKVS